MSIPKHRITFNRLSENYQNLPIFFHAACDKYVQETVRRPSGVSYYHQIMFIVDGKGILKCGGKIYELKKGCAFYTGLNVPVEYINTGGLITAFITAYGPALNDLLKCFPCNGFLYYDYIGGEKFISGIKQLIDLYYTRKPEGTLSAMTYSLFVDFFEYRNSKLTKFEEALMFIEKNFTQKLTLEQIAKVRCVSITKLSLEFKSKMNCTIFEYIINLRLNYAHNLLVSNPEIMIKDAAILSGFNDVSYFCRAYKEKFGKNPSENKTAKKGV